MSLHDMNNHSKQCKIQNSWIATKVIKMHLYTPLSHAWAKICSWPIGSSYVSDNVQHW